MLSLEHSDLSNELRRKCSRIVVKELKDAEDVIILLGANEFCDRAQFCQLFMNRTTWQHFIQYRLFALTHDA